MFQKFFAYQEKRKLTLDMIRKLNEYLRIPTDALIQKY